jgi:hypothetical protein
MKLGITVNSIRSKGYFVDGDEERKQILDELGFEWSMHDKHWADALLLLQTYKQEHGHLKVPAAFVVPSTEPWPEELWGTELGTTVHHIRSFGYFVKDNEEREQLLTDMGLRFETSDYQCPANDATWEHKVKPALLTFKQEH